jgi:hypothetical protein
MPEALKTRTDEHGNEVANGLPPHCPIDAHVVDEYPACPDTWMHGSSKASSYFLGVEEGRGMWLDFTGNSYGHKHDVAIVVSVQGVNPITGQQQRGLNLEQYRNQCPVHKVDFKQDRFCPKCKYSWPAQNYLATTTNHPLWIDGFRTADGKVHQYIMTADEQRGVAAQVIGDDRVYAIGVAFYLSKEEKPQPKYTSYRSNDIIPCSENVIHEVHPMCFTSNCSSLESGMQTNSVTRSTQKKMEVAAGAAIEQEIGVDPKDVNDWEAEPIGMLYINYTSEEEISRILKAGRREEKVAGPLDSIKIGN